MTENFTAPSMDELIEQYSVLLYRYSYRLTGNPDEAEDLTQQVFLLVQQRRHQLREPRAIRSWLLTIVRNVFLKSRRHKSKKRSLDEIAEPFIDDSAGSNLWIDREQLQVALLELSEEFRSAVVLFYFDEFSYQEIAEHLGVPIGTVMSRLSRAKSFLKKRLEKDQPLSADACLEESKALSSIQKSQMIFSHG